LIIAVYFVVIATMVTMVAVGVMVLGVHDIHTSGVKALNNAYLAAP
jgi:hypothetical protein